MIRSPFFNFLTSSGGVNYGNPFDLMEGFEIWFLSVLEFESSSGQKRATAKERGGFRFGSEDSRALGLGEKDELRS